METILRDASQLITGNDAPSGKPTNKPCNVVMEAHDNAPGLRLQTPSTNFTREDDNHAQLDRLMGSQPKAMGYEFPVPAPTGQCGCRPWFARAKKNKTKQPIGLGKKVENIYSKVFAIGECTIPRFLRDDFGHEWGQTECFVKDDIRF